MGLESTITQFKDNMNKDEKLANLTSEQKKEMVKRYISDILCPEIGEKEMWGQ